MKRYNLWILLFSLYLINIFAIAEGKPGASDLQLKNLLQQELESLVKENNFPGASLAVVHPNGAITAVATGKAEIESGKDMTTAHRMFSGSIGKTYVAAVAMQLVCEKKLDLEVPISSFFKDEDWFSHLPNSKEITVRMLMNHTSGIPRYVEKEKLWENVKKNPDKAWTPVERLSYVLGDKPIHPAGKGWGYSDTNYIIVGMIIEKITGNSYYDELEKRILKPLKLKDTIPANKRRLEGLCSGYTKTIPPFNLPSEVLKDGVYAFNPQLEWTGGGLITTPTQLAIWAKQLYGGNVLEESALKKMLTFEKKTGLPEAFDYGLGVMAWKTPNGIAYGHSGFAPGYQSIMQYFPKTGYSLAFQINTDRTTGKFKKSMEQYLPPFTAIIEKSLKPSK